MSALYYDILAGTKNVIDGLSLTGSPSVRLRKRPHVTRVDTLPLIVVSPGFENVVDEYTDNTQNTEYPVFVTMILAGDGALEVGLGTMLTYREEIRKALHKTSLSGVSAVIDARVWVNKAFDPALFGVNYDASQVIVFFKATESRSV